jgi:hypothetical protein
MSNGLSDEGVGARHLEHILGCAKSQVNED